MPGAHFTFKTSAFVDPPEVRRKNVNDLAGCALAAWVSTQLTAKGFKASAPWPEDHGWDFSIEHAGVSYLCVCVLEDGDGQFDAQVSLDLMRSLGDRLLGRNRFATDDAVARCIAEALAGASEVEALVRDT